MRANGYGNSIISRVCKLLVLGYLGNKHVREAQFDTLRWGMTRGAWHAKRLPRQPLRSSREIGQVPGQVLRRNPYGRFRR